MRRRPLRAIYTARWPFENVGKQKPRDPSANETRRTLTRRQGPAQPGRRRDGSISRAGNGSTPLPSRVSRLPPPQSPRGIGS